MTLRALWKKRTFRRKSKMAQKKCVICNELITDEPGVPYKGRYAHQKCFNIAIKTLQKDKEEKIVKKTDGKKNKSPKPRAELKQALSEEEYAEKKKYFEYLRKLTLEEKLSAKVYALTDDYIKRYAFTFTTMYNTLVYLHEIIEKDLTGDVIGLIPYYHTEAQKYFDSVKRVEEVNRDIDVSHMYKEKTIKIQPRKRKIKQIDIESIGNEVE